MMPRPVGAGTQAPDAAAIFQQATRECRDVQSMQAELGLAGRVGHQRIPGLAAATIGAAMTAEGAIGLEARISGQLLFRLGGTRDRAELLLPRENRVVRAKAEEIVEALIGVSLDPARFLAVLSGCVGRDAAVQRAERFGDLLAVTTGDATIYLQRAGADWQPRAGDVTGLHLDYRDVVRGRPAQVQLFSPPGQLPVVSLGIKIKAVNINPTIPPAAFTVTVPSDAEPMTIEELRKSGPAGKDLADLADAHDGYYGYDGYSGYVRDQAPASLAHFFISYGSRVVPVEKAGEAQPRSTYPSYPEYP